MYVWAQVKWHVIIFGVGLQTALPGAGDGAGTERGRSGDVERGRSGDGAGTERGRSGATERRRSGDGAATERGRSGDGAGTEQGRSGDGAGTERREPSGSGGSRAGAERSRAGAERSRAEPTKRTKRSRAEPHIVAGLAIYARSTLAQTGVSGPVVVDGESFLDALFASAGQG